MRQTSDENVAGPGIVIQDENGNDIIKLCNPFKTSTAWQWDSRKKDLRKNFSINSFLFKSLPIIVKLTSCDNDSSKLTNDESMPGEDSFSSGESEDIFYFDDLHVSFERGTYT